MVDADPLELELAMSENPAPAHRVPDLKSYSGLAAGSVLLLAFLIRLWKASGTFLNLD